MKSHPLAPVFAMALLLAILLWLCSSCEKKPQPGYVVCDGKVYVPIEERDSLRVELEDCSEFHKIQMQFDSLLIEYDKARKAFNKAANWDQQTIAWNRQYNILLQEMDLVKKLTPYDECDSIVFQKNYIGK